MTTPSQAEPLWTIGPLESDLIKTTLPGGLALCKAMGVAPDTPCDDNSIVEAAQKQTDHALWVETVVSGMGGPHNGCLRPVAIVSYEVKGRGDGPGTTFACFAPDAEDSITAADLARIQAAAARFNAIQPKTLAQHQRARGLKRIYDWIEEALP